MKSIEDRKVRWSEMQNLTRPGHKFAYIVNNPMHLKTIEFLEFVDNELDPTHE
jgi:hypothetical protein